MKVKLHFLYFNYLPPRHPLEHRRVRRTQPRVRNVVSRVERTRSLKQLSANGLP